MENPRPEKVAVVDEVRKRLADSDAALLTEYRGINVSEMQALRRALQAAGGEYKIYKNTLVRFAARDLGLEIDDLLTGPTAIAFVPTGSGDPVTVAKALQTFAKGNPNLVIKGGLLGTKVLTGDDAKALGDIAPREELLAQFAGLMAAPMTQFARLLQALPQNLAYGIQALIDQGGAPGAPAAAPAAAPEAEAEPADAPAEAVAETPNESDDTPAEAAAPAEATDESATTEENATEES